MQKELWEKAVAFHGHECPGLAIGVKACEAAVERLNISPAEDEDIVCITENDACGVDGIQALLSCTIGKGNLIYRNTGKQAFSFFNRETGDKVRMFLKEDGFKNLHGSERQNYILNAPINEVFTFSEPKYSVPEKARFFNTITCEQCGEGAAEHKIRFQEGKKVCLDCYKPYIRGW